MTQKHVPFRFAFDQFVKQLAPQTGTVCVCVHFSSTCDKGFTTLQFAQACLHMFAKVKSASQLLIRKG